MNKPQFMNTILIEEPRHSWTPWREAHVRGGWQVLARCSSYVPTMAAMGSPSAGAGGAGAGSVPAATIALLDGLMSANNAERNRAEEMYTAALAAPAAVRSSPMAPFSRVLHCCCGPRCSWVALDCHGAV